MAPKLSNTQGVTIDLRGWHEFAIAMKAAPLTIRKSLGLRMKEIGNNVASAAKAEVGQVSTSVPPTIRSSVSSILTVRILAGTKATPLAGLLDRGNKGEAGRGTFRHPVFGDKKTWVDQPMHPFMAPAMAQTRDGNLAILTDGLNEVLRAIADETNAAL